MYNALSSVIAGGRGAQASAGTPRPARRGPSRRRVRTASAVLKNLVRQPEKTFSTVSGNSGLILAPIADAGVSAAVRSTTHRPAVAGFQKRNRSPTVGSILLCWKKPKPNPPCTWLNIMPKYRSHFGENLQSTAAEIASYVPAHCECELSA